MRITAVLSPVANWPAIEEGARQADAAGLVGVGLWDHSHSARLDWGYIAGWAAYGALAALTERVRILPMVLNTLHFGPGVLAKESSVLANLSGGRFVLGLGAGDWPASFRAWGTAFPPATDRLDRLGELVTVLRELWAGGDVTFHGRHLDLNEAICTPAPSVIPEVLVGAGASLSAVRKAAMYADEVNVYPKRELVSEAVAAQSHAGRPERVSVFLDWSYANWPGDLKAELGLWAAAGVSHAAVSVGAEDMPARIERLPSASS